MLKDTCKKDENSNDLFKERLKRDATIKDMEDREFPLLDLMAMAYKYLIGHFHNQLESKSLLKDITPSRDIQWVITVPPIWTDASKQFTKEAAIKAGLLDHQIMFAYEPEAAALFCRLLPVDKFISGGEQKNLVFSSFERGKKFMVLDLGGGTVDISVQETTEDGKMKSIHKVCGGAWGGQAVDEEFRKCIQKLFGGEVIFQFRNEYRSKYLEFLRDFELKKRQAKMTCEPDSKVYLRIPAELCDLLEEMTELSLKKNLSSSPFKDDIDAVGDKLIFRQEKFNSFFSEAMKSVQEHMKEIFKDGRCQNLTGILLVGGFAESEMVIETLRKTFPSQNFIVPSEAGLSVVKGAVLYGQDPEIICARTCRYTYGTSVAEPFRFGVDPLQKRIIISGEYYCNNRYSKTFTIGDLVNIGDKMEIQMFNDYRDVERQICRFQPIDVDVLISKSIDPTYTDDEGVTELGSIEIPLPPEKTKWPEYFSMVVYMEIAGTEIEVSCELETGESTKGRFEFLIE